jgi:threonine dehydrogenase-like Zn-dependent dehydrogenase
MKAAIFRAEKQIELGERPDPTIQDPSDAVVRVVRGCVCGSDLWYYRGINQHKVGSIGHEYIGVVDQVGEAVTGLYFARSQLLTGPCRLAAGSRRGTGARRTTTQSRACRQRGARAPGRVERYKTTCMSTHIGDIHAA